MINLYRNILPYSHYCRRFPLLTVIIVVIGVIILRKTLFYPTAQIDSTHQQIKNSSINNAVQPEVLLIYVYANTHPYALENLKYFVDNAVRENDGADYYFILQNVDNKTVDESGLPSLPRTNAHYIQHENVCFDFGTAGWFLNTFTVGNPWLNQTSITNPETKINITHYKYFILMNSSIRGPFFPPYYLQFIADYKDAFDKIFYWYYVFTKRINDKVKLTGCTISCIPIPHVQSFVLVTDLIGMNLLLKPFADGSNIFKCSKVQIHASFDSEVPSSTRILEAGYMIDSLLTKYQSVNFNEQHNRLCNQHKNPYLDDNLDGVSLEPYEVVFVKYKDQPYLQGPRKRGELYERWTNDANKLNRSMCCIDSRILLYNLANTTLSSAENFDCIYVLDTVDGNHGGSSAGKIPYCRRPDENQNTTEECENGGVKKTFSDLLRQGVRPSQVLEWNSGVAIADDYAASYYHKHTETEAFVCHCIQPGTFGRYCQYRLTHREQTFEASQSLQVKERAIMPYHHQIYGDILCYKTWSCNWGLLCLDWRDICDGEQHCEYGWDEENCEKLEFNECEEDEFRCDNGMCIPEEYWLDGDKDCMDWTDENNRDYVAYWCFEGLPTIDCNEHVCINNMWSCGDGQCIDWFERWIFQKYIPSTRNCDSLRHMNYMCELDRSKKAWTMPSGSCWLFDNGYDDPRLSMDNPSLSNEDKCLYLIRCALSDGFERDCGCDRSNCSNLMTGICQNDVGYLYPPRPLIRPYMYMYYLPTGEFRDKTPSEVHLWGHIRCRGYQGYIHPYLKYYLLIDLQAVTLFRLDSYVCSANLSLKFSDSVVKYDDHCWNSSSTFTGRRYASVDVCETTPRCISQYRINDGLVDCIGGEDERNFRNSADQCARVRRHRLQCSSEERTCLPSFRLGGKESLCSNLHDRFLYGYQRPIAEMPCQKSALADCQLLRDYIRNSSMIDLLGNHSYLHVNPQLNQTSSVIPFRSYCDGIWHQKGHEDESLEHCRHWICHQDQYQCRGGQCIPLEWVCDQQWDCADASDEEGILAIDEWSSHNQNVSGLNERREKCRQDYAHLPFAKFCHQTTEFPCLRSNVSEPLNLTKNLPCIPYAKIGDEIEDCYNAYDEKNTFQSNENSMMWGFSLQCGQTSFPYLFACLQATDECAEILCPYRRGQYPNCSKPTDAICINKPYCVPGGRCNGTSECSYGEDEYWCASNNYIEQKIYRYLKLSFVDRHPILDGLVYPPIASKSIPMAKTWPASDLLYSFGCNRGVTVLMQDKLVCLCSPAYYGRKCQVFGDRITIVTHLQLSTWKTIFASTIPTLFTIRVHFLFNGHIVDQYEFYSDPSIELNNPIKHKFYLLYSRSPEMVAHKAERFSSRTDIEYNHPYSVHFEIYALYSNQSNPIALGSWRYPIYFDFLPAFRFATILRFPHWWKNVTLDPCFKHPCNENSTCQPIFNRYDEYYCACKSGFYGDNCSQYDDVCQSHCAPFALCHPNQRHSCICPLKHFGPRCFLRFEQCNSNPCLNNGTCLYTYEAYSGDAFRCLCSQLFHGDRCQYTKNAIRIQLNISEIADSPRASAIQFYDVKSDALHLALRHQQVTLGIPASIYYAHGLPFAPVLSVLKTHYDSMEPHYFILYLKPNTSSIDTISSPKHCPSASILLATSDVSNKYNLFRYHQICRNHSQVFCFFDQVYFCICQLDRYRVDCFLHDPQIDHCSQCLSDGKCLRGDANSFLCLCPRCHRGDRCEFNIEAFGFTLDALLIDSSKNMKIIYILVVFLLFFVGFFNNLCSFLTFKRPASRKAGVGNYLLIISCFNQLSLFCLLGKTIQITFAVTNLKFCQILPYLFSVFTRLIYWLTSWVTIDRLLIVFFPTATFWKKPTLSIIVSIITIVLLFAMHVHEILYYTTIEHLSTGSSICVTNFRTRLIFIYNRVSTLIHYLGPFLIQVIGITALIILAARSRTKTNAGKITFRQMLMKQFRTQKELYTTPVMIILSALPQTILTFSFACVELTDWHRHTLLVTYLLSYAPQILSFILHVLPSTAYKKEFKETSFAKKSSSWITTITHSTRSLF